ncbi:MAG: hypothetical protein ACLQJ7_09540 [Syntrophobacteraceae bacterium]
MSNLMETNRKNETHNGRKILVLANNGIFTETVINHCVQLAGRLGYDLAALSVDVRFEGRPFEDRSGKSAKKLCEAAVRNGINCSSMIKRGDIEFAVEDAIHEIKRVEIVVVDSETKSESIRNISVPVVSVLSAFKDQGGNAMVAKSESSKAILMGKTAGYGVVSAACYAAVFTHADTVTQICSRGGWYAAIPIATVLAFSFVHGAFAHNLWSLLGIEAMKRDQVRKTEHKVIEKRKQLRKRPRAYAYVNPFHRIDL